MSGKINWYVRCWLQRYYDRYSNYKSERKAHPRIEFNQDCDKETDSLDEVINFILEKLDFCYSYDYLYTTAFEHGGLDWETYQVIRKLGLFREPFTVENVGKDYVDAVFDTTKNTYTITGYSNNKFKQTIIDAIRSDILNNTPAKLVKLDTDKDSFKTFTSKAIKLVFTKNSYDYDQASDPEIRLLKEVFNGYRGQHLLWYEVGVTYSEETQEEKEKETE